MRISLGLETDRLTEVIIGTAYAVSNELGHGFAEVVYKKAFVEELRSRDIPARCEVPFAVSYKGVEVGTYYADLVVNDLVIVELKAVEAVVDAHVKQVLNYLRASRLDVGLIFNFGTPKLAFRRVLSPMFSGRSAVDP